MSEGRSIEEESNIFPNLRVGSERAVLFNADLEGVHTKRKREERKERETERERERRETERGEGLCTV